ncbi:hypothetical protein RvY_16830 [Ramazzottius varieornatus]|uniref:Uncharacterized protein n=1 Tax=Ramazzottius varieornatus TaxID=947166 RepID=A0A1D1W0K3_RAMVA|nr:hypothetical protein RvY_16830 [Ramazzottius varieornatus]
MNRLGEQDLIEASNLNEKSPDEQYRWPLFTKQSSEMSMIDDIPMSQEDLKSTGTYNSEKHAKFEKQDCTGKQSPA